MIITKLVGGLGNQMFQYAAGRAVALRNNDLLKLDISRFEFQNKLDTPRHYELNIFEMKPRIATISEINGLKKKQGSLFERVLRNRFPQVSKVIFTENGTYYFENTDHRFEEKILHIRGDAYLEGWWNSEKYFKDYKTTIINDFKFRNKILNTYSKYLIEIKRGGCVSLHVRLGDYIHKYKGYFAECTPGYYQQAVATILKKTKINKILIICEDKEWADRYLNFDVSSQLLPIANSERDWEDIMQLMSQCDHNIIANSSFSWWAAYLNRNPNKIVVAPKKWLVKQNFPISDRIPESWLTL